MAERAQLLSDDDLLSALAASFPIEPVEPDPALLLQLSVAVAALRQKHAPAPTPSPGATHRLSWNLPRRLSPAVLAAAVVGVVGAGTGISYAVGVPIPAAVRSIAHSVGLATPATPTIAPPATTAASTAALRAAQQAESTLHQALSGSNPPLSAISRDSTVLARRLALVGGYPTPGATGTTANGQQLLHAACRHLEGSGAAAGDADTTHAGWNGATFPGCAPGAIAHSPSAPTSPPSTSPTYTRTTRAPSLSHTGAGSGEGPATAPAGGAAGTRTTMPAPSRGHAPGGSSGTRPGDDTAPGSPTHNQGHAVTATNPRSSATSN